MNLVPRPADPPSVDSKTLRGQINDLLALVATAAGLVKPEKLEVMVLDFQAATEFLAKHDCLQEQVHRLHAEVAKSLEGCEIK